MACQQERQDLMTAHRCVVRKGGAPGIDGMSEEEPMPYCREHWVRIREELLCGTHRTQPSGQAEIPESGEGVLYSVGIRKGQIRLYIAMISRVLS